MRLFLWDRSLVVKHDAYNIEVDGSNPSDPTILYRKLTHNEKLHQNMFV